MGNRVRRRIGMYEYDRLTTLQFIEDRLQNSIAQIHTGGVREQRKSIEPEDVKCVRQLLQGRIDIRSGIQAKPANRSGRARTSSAANSLHRRARAEALALSPVCTPGVLTERTATSIPASSMNERVASLDHRSGASPPTGA